MNHLKKQSRKTQRDEELIYQFVKEGDRDAFEILVKRHLKGIRRLLYGLLNGNEEDMKDAEQEILFSLFKTVSHFRGHSSFKTFLYRITRNKAIDLIRRRRREMRIHDLTPFQNPFNSSTPSDQLEQKESRRAILDILERLRSEEKTILLLKEVERLSIREISQVTGIAQGTVKSRLHRIREKVARLLGDKR